MADSNVEVPMELGDDEGNIQQPSTHPGTSAEDISQGKDDVQVTLSLKWSEDVALYKFQRELEMLLQSWLNRNDKLGGDCKVLNVSEDGRAGILLKPAPGKCIPASELQELSGLQLKRKYGQTVSIMSVTLTELEPETQIPEASMNLSPSFVTVPQDAGVPLGEQSSAVSTRGEETCTVPVGHFWYVNHIYKEEIKRIEEQNGIKITADVKIAFLEDKKDGSPQKALSEFTSLVQKCLGDSDGSTVPLKEVDPEEWKDAMKFAQIKENKLLLTISSEEMTLCGPRQSQDTIKKSLNATQKMLNTRTTVGESTWEPQDTPLNVGMSIKDPLVNAGLTMEESYWKLMTNTCDRAVHKIKTKFGVDFKESGASQGNIKVKAYYKSSGGNAAMESHSLRALLHLYQKIATSSMSSTGFTGSSENLIHFGQSDEASGGPVLNGQSGNNTDAPTGGGATAGNDEEDICAICRDTFTNKRQLKCKHEFCEECLEQLKKSMGPTCPICKDVFGMMEGDQPDGKMTWSSNQMSLPGFGGCGTITIIYHFPDGKQTKKHPNPGRNFTGIYRTAYLPDNQEGREVLKLLKKAFDQKLIFTIGTSRTTGLDNQVTWNDIHHKTSMTGGPSCFGYPDPNYLGRVREELKDKGIE